MDDHTHIPVTITTLCFFILITILPQSLSQQQDTNSTSSYTVCSSSEYNCGESFSSISYPFWGNNRPSYCGGNPQFNLSCDANQNTSIQIASQNFTVLEIDNSAETMKLQTQLAFDVCSTDFPNITLNSSVFGYTKNVHYITIFYGCPAGVSTGGNNFTCEYSRYRRQNSSLNLNVFHIDVNETLVQQFPGLQSCQRLVKVPALLNQTVDPNGLSGIDALKQALVSGFEVKYIDEYSEQCLRCRESGGACGSNTNDTAIHQFTCYCPNGFSDLQCSTPHNYGGSTRFSWERKAIIGVSAAVAGSILMCIVFCCRGCKSSTWREKFCLTTNNELDVEAFLKNHGALAQKRYKFSEVKKMTNSFKVQLGQGGFGVVYKGKLLGTGCPIAVKLLNASKGNGEDFINEVASISRTSHVNIVTLLGFCLEGRKKALIYEFMPNGSLDKFIYKMGPETFASLSWENLYQIAIGIARGLEYLHRGCNTRILHFDIKPHNILLDENLCPKISDFGLAKLCHKKESIISMSDARGTMGYVAPEVWNRHFGGVSHKSDVYSYGMMLLEMVGGRKNINAEASHTSEIYFPHWVYNRLELGSDLRPNEVMSKEENDIAKRMTIVGLWCIQTLPNDRPTISKVIDMLEGSMDSLEMPPKPLHSSPTRSEPESST